MTEQVFTTSNLIASFTPVKLTAKAQPKGKTTSPPDQPTKRKTPQADLGAQQRIATAGETVPIVFGKRVSGKGGVWVQPSLVRSGSNFFKGSFLFAVSQGQIVSSPVKYRIWVGLRNLSFLGTSAITVSAVYSSASTVNGSRSTCPILGGGLYCGNDTYTYITQLIPSSGEFIERRDWVNTSYNGFRRIARGTGDTTNSAIEATLQVFDNEGGADLTAAFFAYLGVPSNTVIRFNTKTDSGGSIIGAYAVGVVADFIGGTNIPAGTTLGYLPIDPVWAAIGATAGVSLKYTITGVNNQINPSNPASTGTLDGVQTEYVISKYANPNSTPNADNSAFAEITFLKIVGDIYDPPDGGSYPTTTRQVSIYYEQGVRVTLYSAGGSTQGASNQLVDLAMYLFTIYKRTTDTDPDVAAPIFTGNMQNLATFCNTYFLHFNGVISDSLNIIEYIAEIAPYFLLSFQSNGGQYRFAPLLPLNGSQAIQSTALTPAATFTEDEILPGSFTKTYLPASDKTDVNVSVLYRLNNPDEIGTQQTVQVRYSTVGLDAPIEQFDMSDFCANRDHAIIYAKHFLARRKYSVHSISFSTPLSTAGLIPTSIIKIERQRITSTGDNRTETEWYQITSVDYSADGTTKIEAAQFPVNGSNIARISSDVLSGTFTIV